MVSLTAAQVGVGVARKGKEKVGELYQEKFGYNFVDLVTKLALFYIVAFLISKYMEAVIYFQGGLQTIAGFFGIKFAQADQLPKQWVNLFVDPTVPGFEGGLITESVTAQRLITRGLDPEGWDKPYKFGSVEHQQAEPHLFMEGSAVKYKFWDLINAIVIFYIGWEAYKYYRNGGRDFLTIAIFSLLGLMVGMLSFSKFLGKFSLNRFQEENK